MPSLFKQVVKIVDYSKAKYIFMDLLVHAVILVIHN